jgi:hypothetical protein
MTDFIERMRRLDRWLETHVAGKLNDIARGLAAPPVPAEVWHGAHEEASASPPMDPVDEILHMAYLSEAGLTIRMTPRGENAIEIQTRLDDGRRIRTGDISMTRREVDGLRGNEGRALRLGLDRAAMQLIRNIIEERACSIES